MSEAKIIASQTSKTKNVNIILSEQGPYYPIVHDDHYYW